MKTARPFRWTLAVALGAVGTPACDAGERSESRANGNGTGAVDSLGSGEPVRPELGGSRAAADGGSAFGADGGGLPRPSADPEPSVDTDAEELLRVVVRFYGAQRSGDHGNWLLMQYPSDQESCFLADGLALDGRDLSAGWFDAGDHIKPTLTNAYAAFVMLQAYEAFPEVFDDLYGPRDPLAAGADVRGTPNGVPDVLDEVKAAADFLGEMVVGNSAFVLQVGDVDADHSSFVPCPRQDDMTVGAGGELQGGSRVGRPVFTGQNAHIGGVAAAALAMMSRHYEPFDASTAARYLDVARSVYDIADLSAGPGPGPYRGNKPEVGMLCGAAELYRATGEPSYLEDASGLANGLANHGWVAGWDNPHEFCWRSLHLAGEEAGEPSDALDRWQSNLATNTEQGLIYESSWGEWGVLRYATTAAFSAVLYREIQPTADYAELAIDQVAWVTGDNAHGRSFVIGFGPNPPENPHHRNAEGAGLLYGALVGGPEPGGTYQDNVNDFVKNEVAIDYNAGLVGLAAFAVAEERRF